MLQTRRDQHLGDVGAERQSKNDSIFCWANNSIYACQHADDRATDLASVSCKAAQECLNCLLWAWGAVTPCICYTPLHQRDAGTCTVRQTLGSLSNHSRTHIRGWKDPHSLQYYIFIRHHHLPHVNNFLKSFSPALRHRFA